MLAKRDVTCLNHYRGGVVFLVLCSGGCGLFLGLRFSGNILVHSACCSRHEGWDNHR